MTSNFPRSSGLRARITLALAAVALLSAILTGAASMAISARSLKAQKHEDELAIARNVAVQVDEALGKALRTVEALSQHPVFESMDLRRQREALTLVTRVTELIDGIAALDLNGRVLAMDRVEPATEGLLPEDAREHLVRGVLEGRGVHFSAVFRNALGDPLVAINAPIESSGRLRGVLSGIILLKNHSLGGIEDIRIGKTGYAYLVDSDGTVLVHPQRRRVMENLRAHPPVRALLSAREGVIEFVNQEGVPVLAAFAPIERTGWGVVVRQPAAESYAHARHARVALTAAALVALAASLALGARLARRVSDPLSELAIRVQSLMDGDLSARFPETGDHESARLAAAFNELAKRLRSRIEGMRAAHEKMVETQRLLARNDRLAAVGQLAAGLAHEINNPLNVMSGFCELLAARTPEDDPRRAFVDEILRECLRCQRLVSDLLGFARSRPERKASVDLGELMEETLNLIRAKASSQGVSILLEKGRASAYADREQLKQVALNLLLNALEAMPRGGVLALRVEERGASARFEVRDSGPGLPEGLREKVFDPFYTTKEGGTGLGLAVSRAIVEAHGGAIALDDAPGGGARATVELPVKGEADVAAA